jgi:hypothetical protein
MSAKLFRILIAVCGILGVAALMVSFSINPAPPAGATVPQIVVWGKQHATLIQAGAWLQGIGSMLEVIFMLGILRLTNATQSLAGWIMAFAATVVAGISFVEVSFYLSAINGGASGDLTTLAVSLNLIKAIQHAYVIAPAPANLLALGVLLLTSHLVPKVFGYLALLLGAVLGMLGLIGTFIPMQGVIDGVLSVQELWFLALAITLIVTVKKVTNTVARPEKTSGYNMAGVIE